MTMKMSKHFMPGAAMASLLLHQELLSLLITKGVFTRDEILEHLDSTLLAAEESQALLEAASSGGAEEFSVPAVRSHLELLRMQMQTRHSRKG
jgi:hypothetical protein